MINASLDNPITPFNFKIEGTTVTFTIDGNETAESLRGLNRRITKPDGTTMVITVKASTPPVTTLDDELRELIKQVMSRRYAADLGYLDLSNFRKDETFTSKELYIPLDRVLFSREVVKVILENIPNLKILNLANNRLRTLEPFSAMKGSCSLIKAINLSKNKVGLTPVKEFSQTGTNIITFPS
jgi:nuclear RNA export factor